MEREEEMRFYENEMRNLTGVERERRGRAILHLRGRDAGRGLGGKFLIKFLRETPRQELPETDISVGDLVMLSKGNPLKGKNPTGTVSEKRRYSLIVAFDEKPQSFLLKKGLRADFYVNDITFQRMLDSLTRFKNARGRLLKLQGNILGFSKPEFTGEMEVKLINPTLNLSQKKAVGRALKAKDFFLIHGPPGTGKTITCIEIIQQSILRGAKVLATADSNTAVDNLVELLARNDVCVVRVGHPARVTPALRKHTLDHIIEGNPNYPASQILRERAFKIKEKQESLTAPSQRWRRGMSDDKIRRLASKGMNLRGVSSENIQEMAQWLTLRAEADDLFNKSNELEDKAVDEVLDGADVVCATNSTAGSELMGSRMFDLVIIDEATQSTEPSCLIPIIHGSKVIMAGDHKQLPPTILNAKAEKKGLGETLFQRLLGLYGKDIKEILEIQYRMHEDIMDFPNREFYGGRLKADEDVKSHRLGDLRGVGGEISPPLIFVDTSLMNAGERTPPGSTSKENPLEAELVKEITEKLCNAGLGGGEIAVISPYDAQVDLLRREIRVDDLEIKTVDGFQGREKEAVVISFTRSNPAGDVGFLRDLRRLNVAITRARRKLILVGDAKTLSAHPTYLRLINYIKERGVIYHSMNDFSL